jgi:serine/threonine protein kinase
MMQAEEEMKSYEQIVEDTQLRTGTVTKQDFQMLSVIGKGAYGKVLLVKKKEKDLTKQADGELYAMKVLKKSEILRRNQVEHTMTERRILVSIPLIHVNFRAL